MRIVCPGTRAVNKQSCELSYEMAVVGVWRLFLDEGDCGSELSACRNCADRTLFVLHTPSSTEPGVCGLSDWSLRILNNGLHEYATAHPLKGFPETLQDLYTSVLIDETLAWGAKNHYKFSYLPEIPPVNGSIDRYQIHAQPMDGGNGLYFFTDQSGVIRYKEGAPANQLSSAL